MLPSGLSCGDESVGVEKTSCSRGSTGGDTVKTVEWQNSKSALQRAREEVQLAGTDAMGNPSVEHLIDDPASPSISSSTPSSSPITTFPSSRVPAGPLICDAITNEQMQPDRECALLHQNPIVPDLSHIPSNDGYMIPSSGAVTHEPPPAGSQQPPMKFKRTQKERAKFHPGALYRRQPYAVFTHWRYADAKTGNEEKEWSVYRGKEWGAEMKRERRIRGAGPIWSKRIALELADKE